MKKFIKYLLFGVLTVAIGSMAVGCYGEDIKDLQEKTTSLESRIKALEDASVDLAQLRLDVDKALADAKAALEAAQNPDAYTKAEVDAAVAKAKKEAIEEAQKLVDDLKADIPNMVKDEVDKMLKDVNSSLGALGLRLDQVEADVVTDMIATLQLQKRVLELFDADSAVITKINDYITGLKAGTIGVDDVDLNELQKALEDIDGGLITMFMGQITGIELFPSLSGHAANILVNGLRAMGTNIDWDRDPIELINDFFSWNPTVRDLVGNLVIDFAATRGAVNYKFGAGVGDGLPVAGNPIEFKKDYITRPTSTSFVVKVNPANANLADPSNVLMFVRGADGDIDVNDYLEFGTPTRYTAPLGGSLTRANVDTGLWEIPVKLKEGASIAGMDQLVTYYENGVPQVIVDEDVHEMVKNVPIEYRYRKNLFGLGVTKKTASGNYDQASLEGNLVISKYEIGLYPLDLQPVYNRYDVEANGQTIRADEFKFSVATTVNNIETKEHHVAIHNRFENVENPGPTTPSVPMELRWVNGKANSTIWDNKYYKWADVALLPTHIQPDGERYGVNATPAINTKADYNPYEAVNGPTHGDNRQLQSLFKVQAGTPFTISIDNASLVSHYYVTLDEQWALESQPSELNAWKTYTYTGEKITFDGTEYTTNLNTVLPAFVPTTLTISGATVANDIIGFRLYIVNYDGTLVDPDGKSFYVLVTEKDSGGAIEVDIRWPRPPYYAAPNNLQYTTKNGNGNDGTTMTDYVITTRSEFKVERGEISKANLDASGVRAELTVAYEGDAAYWTPANQVPMSSLRRYASATSTTTVSTWAATNYVGFEVINPRGIKDDSNIKGVLTFYKEIYNETHMLNEEVQLAQWTVTINKKMPKFPEEVTYKNEILVTEANGDKVLYAYPTERLSESVLTPNAPFGGSIGTAAAGNYNFNSAIWFGNGDVSNFYGITANNNYIAGFRFFNHPTTVTSGVPYPYYGDNGLNGFINHDSRIYAEEIGLANPANVATGYANANDEVGSNHDYVLTAYRTKSNAPRQQELFKAKLTYGWGFIKWATGNVSANQLYWAEANNVEEGVTPITPYEIPIRYRSFIQDLEVDWVKNKPELIYNALESKWAITRVKDLVAQSKTGNPFDLEFKVDAKYTSDIPRDYVVKKVIIWTLGTDGKYSRMNEFFAPKVPSDPDYPTTVDGQPNENTIVWKPVQQQDTPGVVQGQISLDIEDEFGHIYRVYFEDMIEMKPAS